LAGCGRVQGPATGAHEEEGQRPLGWSNITESPHVDHKIVASSRLRERQQALRRQAFRTDPRALASAFAARIGVDVVFYIFTLYLLTYLTDQVGVDRGTGLNAAFLGSAAQLSAEPMDCAQ
jgi:hypothetical protein